MTIVAIVSMWLVGLCITAVIEPVSTRRGYYAASNRVLIASGAKIEVVFVGDSITQRWPTYGATSWRPNWINRGIGGERSDQLRERFGRDVLALRPLAVVILIGTNDAWVNNPKLPLIATEANIAAMASRARNENIRALIASVPPIGRRITAPGLPMPRDAELRLEAQNAWAKDYAGRKGDGLVDYRRVMRPDLTTDGVHPSAAGYALMAREVLRALAQ
jgi:lysophospholipase L1-like esterase